MTENIINLLDVSDLKERLIRAEKANENLIKRNAELASRVRYKEEEIEELKLDVEFWRNGYKLELALNKKWSELVNNHITQNKALTGEGVAKHG